MKIKFCGAAKIVTGSCHYIQTNNKHILIDCGMYQGNKETIKMNYLPFKFDPKKIDYLILTHAHIDHSGLIPKLINDGFRGKILCTPPTKELAKHLLADSGALHEMEEKWKNRRLLRRGLPPREPLYTKREALDSIKYFKTYKYNEEIEISKTIKFTFHDAGHILGSAFIEFMTFEENKWKKIIFSGDLGQIGSPIIPDPEVARNADYLIIESTYGDRLHENIEKRKQLLLDYIFEAKSSQGKLLIPSFAMERTQELLFYMNEFFERGLVPKTMKTYIDSPLAINITEVFKKFPTYLNDEARELLKSHDNPFHFPGLTYTGETSASIALNESQKSAIIIAGSGMCTGGRIKHHLKHNLWKDNTVVVFVGYQATGTLGRWIQGGAKKVKMLGEEIAVKAKVHTIGSFSAHADYQGIINWIKYINGLKKIFIVHGEIKSAQSLSEKLQKANYKTKIPNLYEEVII